MANNDSNEEFVDSDKRKPPGTTPKRRASTDNPKSGTGALTPGGVGSAGGKRAKRGKQMRDANAPRQPLNGYVRYLNSNRERAKGANPNLSFADITKLLAAEWMALPDEGKRQYLDEAERAKEAYQRELEEYQRTDAYQEFQQKLRQRKEQKQAMKAAAAAGGQASGAGNTGAGGGGRHALANDENQESMAMDTTTPGGTGSSSSTLDLPIFTEEFLDHNRVREQELRSLRKLNTEYEEQNAILSKHIDNMKSAIEKLEVEAVQQRTNNGALQQHLQHLRAMLLKAFAAIAIPGTNETPTPDTIDDYMLRLHSKLTAKEGRGRDADALLDKVRGIVSALDYSFH